MNSTSTCLFKCLAKRAKIVDRSFGLPCFFHPDRKSGMEGYIPLLNNHLSKISEGFRLIYISCHHIVSPNMLHLSDCHKPTHRHISRYVYLSDATKVPSMAYRHRARCDLPYERKPNMQGLQVAESYLRFQKIIYQSTSFKIFQIKYWVSCWLSVIIFHIHL